MFQGKFLVSVVVVLALIGFAGSECRAESEIRLKDGRVIKVDSFWREDGMVKYETRAGIVGISLNDVAQIITPDMVAFDETRESDTIDVYRNFLNKFPKSRFTEQAKERIIELQFEEVRAIDTSKVYLDYAKRNPSSPFVEEANERAEVLVYEELAGEPVAEKYTEYLQVFPEGRHVSEVLAGLEKVEYEEAKNSADVEAIEAFLAKYPNTSYREELTQVTADLKAAAQTRAQQKSEQEKKRRELDAVQSKTSRKLWLGVGAGLLGLALAVPGVFFFLRRRSVEEPDIVDEEVEDFLGGGAEEERSLADFGPGRYEDIMGVERKPENPELPDSPPAGSNPDEPVALPTPEWAEKKPPEPSEDEGSAVLKTADTLPDSPFPEPPVEEARPQQAGRAPGPDPQAAEEVIDLSDRDTDFKVELEDIPEAPATEQPAEPSAEPDSVDLSDGDLPDLFADEETIRRRGGRV